MRLHQQIPTVVILLSGVLRAQAPAEKSQLEIGYEQRTRNENWNNLFDWTDATDDQRNQIRWRTRFWAKIPVSETIDVVAGLNQETNQINGKDNKLDEVIFETAYVDFKKLFVKGLALRVGRQNLMRGEGFVLFEGNPWDGSRTIYNNAAVLSYTYKKSTLELIGILDPSRDRFLPVMHNQHRLLQEWDEQAVGAYYTNRAAKRTSVEAYYFYKKEIKDTRAASDAQFQPDRHIHTVGGRVVHKIDSHWSATGELALQRGAQHGGVRLLGAGGYAYLKRTWEHAWKPYAQVGYWGQSGDDPATPCKNEGWDPLFSRWPKWSELYIYSQFKERGVAYWTNLSMWQAEAGFKPLKPLDLRFTYYHMEAFQPFAGTPKIFGQGTARGDNLQARLGVTVNKNWSGHVLYEGHLPGNFYTYSDPSYFLRFEIIYLVKWATPARWLASAAHAPARKS